MSLIARPVRALGIDICVQRQLGHIVANHRCFGSHHRRRRAAYTKALHDPDTHPGTLKKLREGATKPSHDLLRYLAEEKIHKVETTADRRNLWFTLQFKRYAPIFLGQMKPRMNFWTAALDESQLPLPQLPEVAIAGRSNCGKSTLVNYLCGRFSAKVKREPGSTQELVFWRIGRPAQLCLVDLPGYGFAVASEERRLQWTEFALWYLRSRRNLSHVLLLIDARQGLKPSDKEMIAYLERHNVSWQIVATKCDTVKQKNLGRRLAVLEEDVASYVKMTGPPIPISALKRMGMEKLRNVLDAFKVQKEYVKEGIRLRVYDLLEQKRIKRAERSRLKREKRRLQEELEKAEGEKGKEMETLGLNLQQEPATAAGTGFATPSLHDLLDDSKHGEAAAFSNQKDDSGKQVDIASTPVVQEARYKLDDRDSMRVDGFMRSLFPDLPDSTSSPRDIASPPLFENGFAKEPFGAPSLTNFLAGDGVQGLGEPRPNDADSESDSDSEEITRITPSVLRFEPMLAHAGNTEKQESGFQGIENLGPARFPQEIQANEQVSLRPGWARPSSNQDRLYDRDDFASAQDIASGIRRFAPPSPTHTTAGTLMSEARKRYEREWATELESIDGTRSNVADSGKTSQPQAVNKSKILEKKVQSTSRPAYITKGGRKTLSSGRSSWRIVGRPPATILKKKKTKDLDKVFNLAERRGRKRNMGSGLTWGEAKQHWMNWFRKNKGKNRDRVLQADSPKQEDVHADFERRRQLLARRRPADKHSDPSQSLRWRTGPGGAAMSKDDDL